MESYYLPSLTSDLQTAELEGREFHHCIHVMRHKVGDRIRLLDGRGGVYTAEIAQLTRQSASVAVIEVQRVALSDVSGLVVAIAPPRKPARFEMCVEKLTELGVTSIVPLRTQNSEKSKYNADRLTHILVAGMKQSQRVFLPELEGTTDFDDFLRRDMSGAWCGIAIRHLDSEPLMRYDFTGRSVVILIGPEGDFTGEEFEQALGAGFHPVSLGEFRLRTETAAIALTSIVQAKRML